MRSLNFRDVAKPKNENLKESSKKPNSGVLIIEQKL